MTGSFFFCVKYIKTVSKVWIVFKFLEKPVDFTGVREYDEITKREQDRRVRGNVSQTSGAAQPS